MSAPIRSILFVPGDNPSRIAKAEASGTDAMVIDLEDSVTSARRPEARECVSSFLAGHTGRTKVELWVRINPISTPDALLDLAAVISGRPSVILLPKSEGPEDIMTLGHYLDALEVREGLERGSTGIVPVATETAAAAQSLSRFSGQSVPRLKAMTWGAEDLSADVGASTNRSADGQLALTYRMVRSQCLLAAKASGVGAIDTVYPDFRDLDGLASSCRAARSEGFSSCFAIHPSQVPVINEAFSPTDEEIAHARRVIAKFDTRPASGAVAIDGKMYDMPHLKQALQTVKLAAAIKECTG